VAALAGVPSRPHKPCADFLFFTKAGAFVLAAIGDCPIPLQWVVKEYGWLDEHQFLDAVPWR